MVDHYTIIHVALVDLMHVRQTFVQYNIKLSKAISRFPDGKVIKSHDVFVVSDWPIVLRVVFSMRRGDAQKQMAM